MLKRPLRSAFVVTIAASSFATGCSESSDFARPIESGGIDARADAENCGAAISGAPCALEGQQCSDCPQSPYGLACVDGGWTGIDLHGSCNPPGWPFDETGTRPSADSGEDTSFTDSSVTDADAD